jgi:hypothetical protein
MPEIKSTLDLVMEKTKHLTFSKEEKDAKKREDVRNAAKGIIQKYLDHLFSRDDLQEALARLKADYELKSDAVFLAEISDRVTLAGDNQPLFNLLTDLFGITTSSLVGTVAAFQAAVKNESDVHGRALKEKLAVSCQVSGSAVQPNLMADLGWKNRHRALVEQYSRELDHEKQAAIQSNPNQ